MLYPVFTYDDGTEVTASRPDEDGRIFLYVEKFDTLRDEFINATFILPGAEVKSSHGYSEQELVCMSKEYIELQDDIISYIKEKVRRSA